jgi:glycine/D-amino acid oxidase-like deaminating enzyme
MKRDGFNQSLWQSGMSGYSARPVETQNKIYDVVIVGGGVTGITTAFELQKAGFQCLVAEAHSLCFGTSGGTTAHLNNFFDIGYNQVESRFGKEGTRLLAGSANEALSMYQQNMNELGIECGYEQNEGCLFAIDDKQAAELDNILKASQNAGIDVRYTDKIPVPIPFVKAIRYGGQAQLHPAKYVYALAQAFEQAGGSILQECLVTGVKEGDVLEIQSGHGLLRARKMIYASHIPPGVNSLHFRCAPYRSYVMAVTLEDGAYPDGPAYDMIDPYHYYRTQELDGQPYLIAGGEDHKTGHEKDTEAPFRRLEADLRKHFRIREIFCKWSSQYFDPADGLAYIGHLPGSSEQVFVATGFGGNGMTYSHIAARLLTDMISGNKSPYEELFSPGRIKPIAGFSSIVKEGFDVVSSFIGDRLDIVKLESPSQLAEGQGKVVKYDHESVAFYKDETGKLFAVNPACTHLKCIIQWNGTEKSWDCPCHGARYSITGEVLTGPSSKPLQVRTTLNQPT